MTAPVVVESPLVPEEKPRSKARVIAVRVAKGAAAVLVGYYALCLVLLVGYRFVTPPVTLVQLQRRAEALVGGEDYKLRKQFVEYSRLPKHVPRAILAAEDGRFFNHSGFDVTEMRAAGMQIFDGEMPRGASTITQQLMKNLFGVTTRFPVRKLYDAALTPPAEVLLGKERILELYLNNAEWGPGVFGIESAARYHYGISARHLSRAQAAGLAALLPNPLRRTTKNTTEYRGEILRRMAARGW
jgi:monofunctional biosynthetic peptidoglycan transglycosylase